MKATFLPTKNGVWACIQRSVRVNGKSTSQTVRRLGLLADIQKTYGCEDPVQWVRDLAAKMTEEDRAGKQPVSIEFSTDRQIEKGEIQLLNGGHLLLMPTYAKLRLDDICRSIARQARVKYDIDEILRTLVFSRILAPGSKLRTYEFARSMVKPPKFSENDMYRSLSLLSSHINDIQAAVYRNSKKFIDRKERVIYFDCSNYCFEIEDNDKDMIDPQTGEVIVGLRKRGKSKENRPNPIVQAGLFMDGDGIPLSLSVFPGNESEQAWLQPMEQVLGQKFEMTDFVISTDAGLASEDNRRFNMTQGRDYICVQSLPSLKKEDRDMAVAPQGWRIAFCNNPDIITSWPTSDPNHEIFNLAELLKAESSPENQGMLKNVTLYKEIIVEKELKRDNPQWLKMERAHPKEKHKYDNGKPIPRYLSSKRNERIIITYSHDFAKYLKHKRAERLRQSAAIISRKDDKGRQSQQSPRKYINTIYKTTDGQVATKVDMEINEDIVKQEEALDGFYGYGTSLNDDAIDILKARSFHHEIEHLFRTTKTLLDARPVYLSRPDRIKTHFLICFLAMVILKIMQKQLNQTYKDSYKETPLTIDSLVDNLRTFRFDNINNRGYKPVYTRTDLTDQLQQMAGINTNAQLITPTAMNAAYRHVK